MVERSADRRRVVRTPAAFPATVRDRRGRTLARGRTTDISEKGALIVARSTRAAPHTGQAILEITLPAASGPAPRRPAIRTVRYSCRIIRSQKLGHLLCLGLEFVEKIA